MKRLITLLALLALAAGVRAETDYIALDAIDDLVKGRDEFYTPSVSQYIEVEKIVERTAGNGIDIADATASNVIVEIDSSGNVSADGDLTAGDDLIAGDDAEVRGGVLTVGGANGVEGEMAIIRLFSDQCDDPEDYWRIVNTGTVLEIQRGTNNTASFQFQTDYDFWAKRDVLSSRDMHAYGNAIVASNLTVGGNAGITGNFSSANVTTDQAQVDGDLTINGGLLDFVQLNVAVTNGQVFTPSRSSTILSASAALITASTNSVAAPSASGANLPWVALVNDGTNDIYITEGTTLDAGGTVTLGPEDVLLLIGRNASAWSGVYQDN